MKVKENEVFDMEIVAESAFFTKKTPVRRKSNSATELLKDAKFKKESEQVCDIVGT
jgi:hypothetical protein